MMWKQLLTESCEHVNLDEKILLLSDFAELNVLMIVKLQVKVGPGL